jgi:hypothetical protein
MLWFVAVCYSAFFFDRNHEKTIACWPKAEKFVSKLMDLPKLHCKTIPCYSGVQQEISASVMFRQHTAIHA